MSDPQDFGQQMFEAIAALGRRVEAIERGEPLDIMDPSVQTMTQTEVELRQMLDQISEGWRSLVIKPSAAESMLIAIVPMLRVAVSNICPPELLQATLQAMARLLDKIDGNQIAEDTALIRNTLFWLRSREGIAPGVVAAIDRLFEFEYARPEPTEAPVEMDEQPVDPPMAPAEAVQVMQHIAERHAPVEPAAEPVGGHLRLDISQMDWDKRVALADLFKLDPATWQPLPDCGCSG